MSANFGSAAAESENDTASENNAKRARQNLRKQRLEMENFFGAIGISCMMISFKSWLFCTVEQKEAAPK
jgi:hypothetical protein